MNTVLDFPEVKVSAKPVCRSIHLPKRGGKAVGKAISFWHRGNYIAVYAKGGHETTRIPECVFDLVVSQYNGLVSMAQANGQNIYLNLM